MRPLQLRARTLTEIQCAADRSCSMDAHAESIMTGCFSALRYAAPNPLSGFHDTKIFMTAPLFNPAREPTLSVGVLLSELPGGGG